MKRNLFRILTMLAVVVWPKLANGETAAQAWVRGYSQIVDSDDQAAKVATDSAGNVFVAGITDDRVNGYDILVIKYSAAGAPVWTNRYNGPGSGNDYAQALAVDGSGNVVVAGTSPGATSASDYVTIKYSNAGVPLWTNRYNGPANDNDQAAAMALDSSGNVYVTGSSIGIGTSQDYATIKYSSAGVPQWTNRFNGSGNGSDEPHAMAVDASGNVYVTGFGDSGISHDYLTVAYSSAGAFLWSRGYDGPSNDDDEANAIAVAGANIFVTGNSYQTNAGNDYLTIAYSSTGVPLWTNRYDGTNHNSDEAFAIAAAGTNVFVTGYSFSSPGTFYDYTTIAYTTAGVPLWTNRYNGPGNATDWASAMALDSSGNVIVTGYSYGGSGTVQDYATVAYSSGGMVLWAARFNGPTNGSDYAQAVATDLSGNVFVTGYSASGTSDDWATIKYSSLGVGMWTNRFNSLAKSDGSAQAVVIDGSGNAIVTGYSIGSGSGNDYATIKYSSTGVALWTNRFVSTQYYDDEANAVAVDGSGTAFVTGNSATSNGEDLVTVAYSSAGAPLWTNRYSEPLSYGAYGQAIAVASAKVYVTGWSYNTNGGSDYLTLAFSSAGTPLWTNRYNVQADMYAQAMALAVDTSGNVIVTGYSSDTNSEDFATVKYSSTGVPLWTNRFDGGVTNNDEARAVAVDTSGNVYVTGFSVDANGYDDFATVKYSSTGVPLWTNRFNGIANATDDPNGLAVDSSGNVFVTGFTDSGSEYDYVTIAYSSAGARLWTNYYSGFANYDSEAQAVAVDGNGRVFVTGFSGSPTGSDFSTIAYSTNGVALWTNRFSAPANLSAAPFTSRSIAVPANGSVVVVGGSGSGGHQDYAVIRYVTVPEVRGLQFGVPGPKMSTLTLAGAATNQYIVQFATNLLTSPWLNLSTNAAGANGSWSVVDSTATNAQRFYRAVVR